MFSRAEPNFFLSSLHLFGQQHLLEQAQIFHSIQTWWTVRLSQCFYGNMGIIIPLHVGEDCFYHFKPVISACQRPKSSLNRRVASEDRCYCNEHLGFLRNSILLERRARGEQGLFSNLPRADERPFKN